MKKMIGIVLLIGFLFVGCDIGTGNKENDETITINNLSIKTTGVKSLYISNISVNNGSRAIGGNSVIQTLSYINNTGENSPLFFTTPSDKNIVLNVSNLRQLDEKRILVDFSSFYAITIDGNVYTIGETIATSGRALIDMKSGKVYDFKGYNNIQFVSNDLLFTLENDTVYKIDLNNVSVATPLNNATYNPIIKIAPQFII
jgi:hypothetical protein